MAKHYNYIVWKVKRIDNLAKRFPSNFTVFAITGMPILL